MKKSLRTGLGFGITSGVITILGLMVGLYSGTQSKLAVIGGILTIAIADSFADSLGIHISKEFENVCRPKGIWIATISTFLSKVVLALFFIFPLLFFSLQTSIRINLTSGILILMGFSAYIAKDRKAPIFPVIAEHLLIAIVVLLATNYVGNWIRSYFF